MQEKEFTDYCEKRKLDKNGIGSAVKAVHDFEEHLVRRGKTFESAEIDDLKEYISLLILQGNNSMDRLLALARYSYVVSKNDFYIYSASVLGANGILPTLSDRVAAIAGEDVRKRVFDGIEEPPLGSIPDVYPKITQCIVARLERELSPAMCRKVLAGNMHQISIEGFRKDKERFLNAKSIDDFLRGLHERAIAELEKHMNMGKLWYEQEITPQVLEFVMGNQEILGGVRRGNRIYLAKIPYSPKDYLNEADPRMKRYYACHCPLVRTSILRGRPEIPPTWCYCSGGYEKLLFDEIFGVPVEVEILESVLLGDHRCRFAIKIPEGKFK